jgi:hypothetical protein
MIYGNPKEKEVVRNSLALLKEEIENEDEDGPHDSLLSLILLLTIIKKIGDRKRRL